MTREEIVLKLREIYAETKKKEAEEEVLKAKKEEETKKCLKGKAIELANTVVNYMIINNKTTIYASLLVVPGKGSYIATNAANDVSCMLVDLLNSFSDAQYSIFKGLLEKELRYYGITFTRMPTDKNYFMMKFEFND